MKKFLTIVMTVIILVAAITSSTVTFAASMPTTTITSIKAQNKAFTVKWKKKSSITGYQIQYSTNSKFKKNNKKIKIKNSKTVSKKITGLNPTQKYYVRIRTYKGKKYSSWSKKKCIIVENSHCTNNSNHSIKCGNIGKWFNNRNDIVEYYKSEVNKWNNKIDNDEITYNEYLKNVPSGYECWSCSYCGKWTGNFKHY
ncbi:MAG: fibronectin type III domain-containing protein [Eubacterium sp.]